MSSNTTPQPPIDLIIIGGGPAGMSAALTAGRARLDTVIINAESPRNAVTTASHGFLTRDGAHPTELLRIAKQQLAKYTTVTYLNQTVSTAEQSDAGFTVTLANHARINAKRLIIATGHVDHLERLGLPGMADVYGKSVYPCIFCDGFEHQDQRLALFGSAAALYAPMVRLWTDDLIVFTNGTELPAAEVAILAANGVSVRTEEIRYLDSDDGQLTAVAFTTGEQVERDAGFISDEYSQPANSFAEQLGVATTVNSWGAPALDVSDIGASTVDGLSVIGDAHTGFGGLIASAAEGAACAAAIVHDIATERWQLASQTPEMASPGSPT